MGKIEPSSSGMATMMVFSTGSRPRVESPHCSIDWNSSGCAAMYGTSSSLSATSAALASL